MKKCFKILFYLLLVLVPVALAQVDLPMDHPSFKSRLNDEFREIDRRLTDLEARVTALE